MGWVGTCGRGQQEKLYQIYSVGYVTQKLAQKLRNVISLCTRRALHTGLNGAIFGFTIKFYLKSMETYPEEEE